eukprot:scaffold2724_cov260-Pinguiococcus_pyrenoidosus.AAC.2
MEVPGGLGEGRLGSWFHQCANGDSNNASDLDVCLEGGLRPVLTGTRKRSTPRRGSTNDDQGNFTPNNYISENMRKLPCQRLRSTNRPTLPKFFRLASNLFKRLAS